MNELEVKIVRLNHMRMLSAYGFGTEPEGIAWEKLKAFAMEKGLLQVGKFPPTYGFNNPNPSKNLAEYGYEVWLPVDESVKPEGDLRIIEFYGGPYAVTTFKGLQQIGDVWERLAAWRVDSGYKAGHHQWLEELTTGPDLPLEDYVFNLYLPIIE